LDFYRVIDADTIECLLCRHHCKLPQDRFGICNINKNQNNSLHTIVTNHPSAIHIDPIEKKPLFHFHPTTQTLSIGTIGCNFRCPFCQNWQLSFGSEIGQMEITPFDMLNIASKYQVKSISYTYNEPSVFYPYAKEIGELVSLKGIKNIFVTNGYESIEEIEDMQWVDAANIDLKSFDSKYYKQVLKGNLDYVLDTIERMYKKGIWIEITTLVIPSIDETQIRQMAQFIASLSSDIPWHLSAFYPNYKMSTASPTTLDTLFAYQQIASEYLKYVYLGNVALPAITYCPTCNKELIIREGFDVVSNILDVDKCPNCHTTIAGVFGDN